MIYLERNINFDKESTFGKLSKLCFLTSLFPKYQKFVDVVEDLKLKEKLNFNMEDHFDKVTFFQKRFDTIQSTEQFKKCKTRSSKWYFILKSNDLKCVNILKQFRFCFQFLVHQHTVKGFLSVMSSKWRNEGNRCSVKIIKNKLFIYFNFKDSCSEFAGKTKDDLQLLKTAKSQTKYN